MTRPLINFAKIASAFAAGAVVGGLAVHHAHRRTDKAAAEAAAAAAAAATPEPAPEPEPQPRPATELGLKLFTSDDTLETISDWVADVRARETAPTGTPPTTLELFLTRRLEEAATAREGLALPNPRVVRPHTNGMFYLRLPQSETNYGSVLATYDIEAALNAGVLAEEIFSLRPPTDESEIYAALDTVNRRITAQVTSLTPAKREGEGEWAARMALSNSLECLRIPYRLVSRFRMNLAEGLAAIEFEVTPIETFPKSALVEGAGIVPTTPDMRARMQTDYTMRLTSLLAECAFAASERVNRVWVAAIERTPESHACLISAAFTRKDIEAFMRDPVADAETLLATVGARINHKNGRLRACQQEFSLNEERFCPPERYEPVGLSNRELTPEEAEALGTHELRGLEIDEGARREKLAESVAMLISPDGQTSCEEAVRAVLELSAETTDERLRTSATRTAERLVEGSLEVDPLAVLEALRDDGGLSSTVSSAQQLLVNGRHEECAELMKKALAPYEAAGAFTDTASDEWRGFTSYVDRVLYNLTLAREGVTTHLVPGAYVEGLLAYSVSLLTTGHTDEAIKLARRAAAICPMSAVVRLHLVQCLDFADQTEEARQQLIMLLTQAHDPEGLGYGYYRMALQLWEESKHKAARASYQRALTFMPYEATDMLRQAGVLMAGPGIMAQGEFSPEDMERALAAEGIPFAPTKEVTHAFMKAARVALDAEIFPVARDFMRVLGAISKDDVLFGVFRSLEDEPDR